MLGLFPGNIVLLRCISAPIDFDDLCSLFVFACFAPFSRNQAVDSYEKKKVWNAPLESDILCNDAGDWLYCYLKSNFSTGVSTHFASAN